MQIGWGQLMSHDAYRFLAWKRALRANWALEISVFFSILCIINGSKNDPAHFFEFLKICILIVFCIFINSKQKEIENENSKSNKKFLKIEKNRIVAFFVRRPSATPTFSKSENCRNKSPWCVLSENIHKNSNAGLIEYRKSA